MSFYASRSGWEPLAYARTTHYAGLGAEPAGRCDSAAEGVTGARDARGEDWSSVVSGGQMILTSQSGSTYSGQQSCDPDAYNEGYIGQWQLRCVTASGTVSETATGYECDIPRRPGRGGGYAQPAAPAPAPAPAAPVPPPPAAPAPAPVPASSSIGPFVFAGGLAALVLVWKVLS